MARAAEAFGVSPQFLRRMIRDSYIPPGRCKTIEAATNGAVTAEQLRPDIFGPAEQDRPDDSNAA